MTSIGNKPAYSRARHETDNEQPGLTFREVLIVAAVQGFCSMPDQNSYTPEMIAQYAIAQADVVIAALEGSAPND